MTIYLDAVWALNFFLDMMLLMLTNYLVKARASHLKLILGAFVASLLVPISFFFPHTIFTTVFGKLSYSLVIILCTFGFYTVFRVVKILFVFYFTTFSIGGGLVALHFLFQHPIAVTSSGILTLQSGYGDPISWLFVVIGFPVIWMFTKSRMDKHATLKIRYDQLFPVTIQINKQSFTTMGYIDSGNQLIDPLTRQPVILGDEVFLKQWFTEEDWQLLKDAHNNLDFNHFPTAWEKRLHIVPYQGVGGQREFLFAIKPDKLVVAYENEQITVSRVLIGIQFALLTKDESYRCLLHPQIIKLSAGSA